MINIINLFHHILDNVFNVVFARKSSFFPSLTKTGTNAFIQLSFQGMQLEFQVGSKFDIGRHFSSGLLSS